MDRNTFSLYVADPQLGSFIGAEKPRQMQVFSSYLAAIYVSRIYLANPEAGIFVGAKKK